jgi:carboxypeptidase C (cathepsin A)
MGRASAGTRPVIFTTESSLGAFPQYMSANNTVHIATESYGGHYGPIFASHIQSQNTRIANKTPSLETAKTINLKSLIIGNGFYDSKTQCPPVTPTTSRHTITSYKPNSSTSTAASKSGCLDQQDACNSGPGANTSANNAVCAAADTFCVANVEDFFDVNIGRIAPDPFPPTFYYDYLNSPKLQAAIGASTNWSAVSGTVFVAFNSTGDESRDGRTLIIPALKTLSEQGVTVILYAGDLDYDSNWLGGQEIAPMAKVKDFGTAGFSKDHYERWNRTWASQQAGLFSFSRIYEAGHEATFYQPLMTYTLFERALM